MELETTVKAFRLMKKVVSITFSFWILETILFLLKDGWHLKAISEYEKNCDKIVDIGSYISYFLFSFVMYGIADYLLSKHNIK